jgi:amidase
MSGFATRWLGVLLGATAWSFAAAPAPGPAPFRYAEATIGQLQQEMQSGRVTARDLAAAYLERIEAIDRRGPALRAVIEINPEALDIAAQLDAERKAGRVRGPLHGIPILIKDNIATADRMETTAGSLALVGSKPPRDAHIVTRLREAGAVILGKTNLSEWANFRSTDSTSGWSGRGGLTLNPYALDRTPSGSSSGSAVAVAANLCVVAIGTETDGSVVSPASHTGIVGFKPTVGLVSRTGIIPIAASQDTAGPMARTVRDAAILLSVIAGVDPDDVATQQRPANFTADFDSGHSPLRGARIGILRGPFGFRVRVDHVLDAMEEVLMDAGAELVDLGEYPALAEIRGPELEVFYYEIKAGLNAYLATLGPDAPHKTLADLIAYNRAHPKEEMPWFGQEHFLRAQTKGPLSDPAYRAARERSLQLARTEGLDAWLEGQQLDAVVAITAGPASVVDVVFGGMMRGGGSSTLAAVAGYPSVTVPAAQIAGLPLGLSFIGRAWSDAKLLALAADFEARTHARRGPKFLPTAQKEP